MSCMPRRIRPTALYLALVCLLLAPSFAPVRLVLAAGPICTVGASGTNYTTVQAAVNDSNCSTINIAAGTYTENISISRNVILQGAGAASTFLDGGQNGRVLNIPSAAAQVQLHDVTLQHGNLSASSFGSAIFNSGTLSIANSIVTDNNIGSSGLGSSIYNNGSLTLNGSQVIKNRHGYTYVGVIYNDTGTLSIHTSQISQNDVSGISNFGGVATITGSTISANSGVGIVNRSIFLSPDGITAIPYTATLTLANSTISSNTASGVSNQGTYALGGIATLTNVTISDNRSSSAGDALWNDAVSTLKLKNSIIAHGSANGNCSGTITSLGHNLEDTNSCALAGPGDLHDSDPLLSPLRDNNGPQPTHALLPGSPAIDTGDNAGCPTDDQRGVARPKDGNADGTATCDIGAYEYQADPLIAGFGPAAATAGGAGFTLTLNGANFTAGATIEWNSTAQTATFVSSTQLTVPISAAEIATGGVAQIRVVGADGKRSNLVPFTINNPLPQLTSMSPTFVSPSGPPATLVITGTNFVSTSEVRLAQYVKLPMTFVSSTQLRATLPEQNADQGRLDISVINPTPGGGESNVLALDIGMEYAGSIGGGVPTVAISGNLAYIGEGSELTVLDVSNPAAPTRIGGLTTRERVQDIELAGSRLYLTDDHDGLLIVDVADPSHPSLLGSIDTPGEAYDVQVIGDRAYVADGGDGLRIIDVSDPAHPVTLGYYDSLAAYDLAVVNNIAYIATGTYATLTQVDVSDPAHPTVLSAWDALYSTYGVQVVGNIAYVTMGDHGLVLVDVTNPRNSFPSTIGSIDTLGKVKDVAVVGTRAYVVNYAGTLHTLDVSDPAHPLLLSSYDTPGNSWDVRVVNGRAYVADGTGGLLILNIANPSAPQKLGTYATWTADVVTVAGNRAYVAGGTTGMQILDVGDPTRPVHLGGLITSGTISDIQITGERAYIAKRGLWNGTSTSGGGLEVVNVADPAHPVSLGSYPLEDIYGVQVLGERAYLAGYGGLFILDISQPSAISQIGATANANYTDLQIIGNSAYVAYNDSGNGLKILDISNPAAPSEIGSAACNGYGRIGDQIRVIGTTVYIANKSQVCVLNIGDPAHPIMKQIYYPRNSSAAINSMEVVGSLIYLAEGTLNDGSIEILDLNAPASAPNNWFIERTMSDQAYDIQLVGQLAYIASGEGGLQILRIHQELFASAGMVTPNGGSFTNRDGSVTLQFPTNAITTPLDLTYVGLVSPTPALGGASSAGLTFALEARDSAGHLITHFAKPYTLVISYTDAQLAALGIDETDLNLAFWNGSAWVNVLPCAGCGVDTVNNRLTAVLDHFTEFAFLSGVPTVGDGKIRVYLPLARR
jgi:hypothetical protein